MFGVRSRFWKTCLLPLLILVYIKTVQAATLRSPSKVMFSVNNDSILEWFYDKEDGQKVRSIQFGVMNSGIRVKLFDVQLSGSGSAFPANPWPSTFAWYENRISWAGDLTSKRITFKITNSTLKDANEFYCRLLLQNPTGTGETVERVKTINLLIVEPPVIYKPFLKNPYVEGNSTSVVCNATGTPTPTVMWVQGPSSQIPKSGEGSVTLFFNPISKKDAGYYRCKANNTAGTKQTELLELVVHYPVNITNRPQNTTVTENEAINLNCDADGFPKPTILWSRVDGSTLQGDKSKETFSIKQSKPKDSGWYKCTATNTVGGKQKSATVVAFVNVHYKPSISTPLRTIKVNESDPLSLQCTADGNPKPVVSWRKSPLLEVIGQDSVYYKPRASKEDSGTYTCTATNTLDSSGAVASIQVTVQYQPVIDFALSSNKTVGSWNNNEIKLRCLADGLPSPDFQWFTPGGSLITPGKSNIPNGTILTIKTDEGDYGDYKCLATNNAGVAEHIINVKQWVKPSKPLNVSLKKRQASYVRLTWTAPSNNGGSPVIDYKIEIQNSGKTADTRVLQNVTGTESWIKQLTPGTAYSVWVSARNIVGYGIATLTTFTTKDKGKPGITTFQDISTKISTTTSIKLSWLAAKENGAPIITYTIWRREVDSSGGTGDWFKQNTTSNELTYTVEGLECDKTYQFGVTAWNKFGEGALDENKGLKQVKIIKPVPSSKEPRRSAGVSAAAIGGGAAAAVIIIVAVIIVIIFLKRRKGSPKKAGESRDPLGSNGDEGYSSVSKASAARRLGRNNAASDDAGIPTYATVDKSKKTPKKPDLIYAELADFNETPEARAASMKRHNQPSSYVPTDYAEITQFGRSKEEPMYDNVPRY